MSNVGAVVIASVLTSAAVLGGLRVCLARRVRRIRARILTPGLPMRTNGTDSKDRAPGRLGTFAERSASALPRTAAAIRLRQKGEMRGAPGQSWSQFSAEHIIALDRIAFVWTARVRGPLGLTVDIVDAYDGTHGLLRAWLAGCMPLASGSGADVDIGEIQRYLAELPWAPGVIARNPYLHYRERPDGSVVVSARPESKLVSLTLTVDEHGHITKAASDARPRSVGKGMIPTPWGGRFSEWRLVDGLEIPVRGEVEWLLQEGPFLYWRGEIVSIDVLDRDGLAIARH